MPIEKSRPTIPKANTPSMAWHRHLRAMVNGTMLSINSCSASNAIQASHLLKRLSSSQNPKAIIKMPLYSSPHNDTTKPNSTSNAISRAKNGSPIKPLPLALSISSKRATSQSANNTPSCCEKSVRRPSTHRRVISPLSTSISGRKNKSKASYGYSIRRRGRRTKRLRAKTISSSMQNLSTIRRNCVF